MGPMIEQGGAQFAVPAIYVLAKLKDSFFVHPGGHIEQVEGDRLWNPHDPALAALENLLQFVGYHRFDNAIIRYL